MRVALFFDGKNFYHGWKDSASEHRVNFSSLASWLVRRASGDRLWGAYYYTGIETGSAAETVSQQHLSQFLNRLETLPGYFVQRCMRKNRSIRCESCGTVNRFTEEKEVDTTMVADILRLAAVNAFDVMVLVSGDTDHGPAVDGARSLGKQVYVASWGGSGLSSRLRKAAFEHIDLLEGLDAFSDHEETSAEDAAEQRSSSETEESPDAVFLSELAHAEKKFAGGYVGLNHFVRNWHSDRLDSTPQGRRRILDQLTREGRVEIYTAEDGNQAIRLKRPE